MNPMKLVQLKPELTEFKNRHPKFFQFFGYASKSELRKGSILEVKVVNPEGRETCTNIKLTAEDEAFFKNLTAAL